MSYDFTLYNNYFCDIILLTISGRIFDYLILLQFPVLTLVPHTL